MRHRRVRPFAFATYVLASCTGGCFIFSGPSHTGHVDDARCELSFNDISEPKDRTRICQIVGNYAENHEVEPSTVPDSSKFTLSFKVSDLSDLNKIDGELRWVSTNDKWDQVLNVANPRFTIEYDTTSLNIKVRILVTLMSDPGSKVYWKFEGGGENEVTTLVGSAGSVEFPVVVPKGKSFIYTRSVKEQVQKFKKLDLNTQEATDINSEEYSH